MKNLEKKIICVIASLFLMASCIASIFTYVKKKDLNMAVKTAHPFNSMFYYTYGKTNFLIGKNYNVDVEANVYRLRNNHLAFERKQNFPSYHWKQIDSFYTFLRKQGVNYGFVLTAESGDERQGMLPIGIETNHCEVATKNFIQLCEKFHYDYII